MLNDVNVLLASKGYVFAGPVGTAPPNARQLAEFNAETFGAHQYSLKADNTPSGGKFKLTANSQATEDLEYDATAAQIQAALAKVLGEGNAVVLGEALDGDGFTVAFIGTLYGQSVTLEVSGSVTPSNAAPKVAEVSQPNGWRAIGHTAEDTLPEFGFEGGEYEAKGSWQKRALREIQTEAPADYVVVNLIQFDDGTFRYYYGENASKVKGTFGVSSDAKPVEEAFMVITEDGARRLAWASPKASIRRDAAIEMSREDFAMMPIRATFMDYPGRNKLDIVFSE